MITNDKLPIAISSPSKTAIVATPVRGKNGRQKTASVRCGSIFISTEKKSGGNMHSLWSYLKQVGLVGLVVAFLTLSAMSSPQARVPPSRHLSIGRAPSTDENASTISIVPPFLYVKYQPLVKRQWLQVQISRCAEMARGAMERVNHKVKNVRREQIEKSRALSRAMIHHILIVLKELR